MAFGALMECRPTAQGRTMRVSITIAALLFMTSELCGCSSNRNYSSPALEGQVMDFKTGKPIDDALVVAQWWGTSKSHSASKRCIQMEVTRSDHMGRYATKGWKRE